MKKIINVILILSVFFIIIILLGKLVSLKYVNEFPEGSFTSDYYLEENNHDVIILGDCEAYTSFSPIELYEKYGITSYIRGNSQQLIGQSYYLLKETLKYEKPKMVILSVGIMRYDQQTKEEYNRLMIDKMRWSKEKVDVINYSMLDNETFISYVFPLLRYHSRIMKLQNDDLEYLWGNKEVSHNGFIINTDVKPLGKLPSMTFLNNYNFGKQNYHYLNKIVDLCKKNNIKLILYKAPTLYPFWYDEYNIQIKNYAEKNNLDYYNFMELTNEIGIDYNYDTYDNAVHLNLFGAQKLTNYFGKILHDKYQLSDYRNNDKIKIDYENKLERYYKEINEKNS